jgi:hypothetical protein
MYRDTANVKRKMYDYTSNNWSQRTVTKGLKKNFEAIPRKYSTDSLQKTATLGTSHIVQKVLQSETSSLTSGGHHWFKRRIGTKGL